MSHTLLLADDSVTIQRVIELTFADEDVQVVAVSNGDEAIATIDRTPPDIVLADVGMPGPNGYQVAQHIKNTPRLAHIPVVLLTGAFEPIDQAKATEVGCDGVLAKPFEPQLVIGRVKELLAKGKQVPGSIDAQRSPPPVQAPPLTTPTPLVAPVSPGVVARGSGQSDDYFDRLGQAFANLSGAAQPVDTKPKASTKPMMTDAIDWFASQPLAAPPDLPLSYAASAPPVDTARGGPFDTAQGGPFDTAQGEPFDTAQREPFDAAQHVPFDTAQGGPFDRSQGGPFDRTQRGTFPPPTLPPLVDAFTALLAAEQGAPLPQAAPRWPTSAPPAAGVTDDVVEQVTRSVLDRLTDRIVRETVAEKVSTIAERLIREEIERIKGAIK